MSSELLSPAEAHERKAGSGGWKHLDVRSDAEYAQGHPPDTVNVPVMHFNNPEGPTRVPDFVDQVAEKFDKKAPLIVSCQSGKRSAMAVKLLKDAGFQKLADVDGGFAAWTQTPGLPVEK